MSGNYVYYLSRVQFFAVGGSILLILFLFWLIRRRKLLVEYSLLWLAVFSIFLVIAVFGGLLGEISRFFGILYPPASLFILLIIGIFMLLLHYSTSISDLKRKLNELSLKLALLENRTRPREEPAAGEGPRAGGNPGDDAGERPGRS